MKPQKKLKKIIKDTPATIEAFVAQEALGHENLSHFFNDLATYGCVSGMVSSLIYYRQTHQFFDCYYEQINELRLEYEENTGTQIQLGSDLKNTLAWFAFEETAFQMGSDLGLL